MKRMVLATVLAVIAQLPSRLSAQDSLPGGFGSLKRDDIAVHFSNGQLDVQVLPLKEWIIRLLAPDTYRSLSDLIRSRQAAIDEIAMRNGVSRPTLIQVTFSGLVPQARFSPEELNVASGGQLFRPLGIVALSPRWSGYQLNPREQVTAIYVFDEGITFREDFIVSYQGASINSWARGLRALDQERARVRARSGSTAVEPR